MRRAALLAACLAFALTSIASADEPAAEKPPAVSLAKGRYIRVSHKGIDHIVSLAEVQVIETGSGKQLQKTGTATQSSEKEDAKAGRASDGNTDQDFFTGGSVSHTDLEQDPWWELDLGAVKDIGRIKIYNRGDCCGTRLNGATIQILDGDYGAAWVSSINNAADSSVHEFQKSQKSLAKGRYVRISLEGGDHILALSEVEVLETGTGKPLQKGGTASQSSVEHDGEAARAIDGNTNQDYYANSTSHTEFEQNPYWELDLGATRDIGEVKVYNRSDCCGQRLSGAQVEVLDDGQNQVWHGKIGTATDGSVHDFVAP